MSLIKGGARQEDVFHTVRILMRQGMTVNQAIAEVESILHRRLPENIKSLIYQECG